MKYSLAIGSSRLSVLSAFLSAGLLGACSESDDAGNNGINGTLNSSTGGSGVGPAGTGATAGNGTGSVAGMGTGAADALGTGAVAGTGGAAGTGAAAGTGGAAGTGAAAGTGGVAGTGAAAGTGGVAGTGAAAGTGGVGGSIDVEPGPDPLLGDVGFTVSSRTFEGELVVGLTGTGEIHYTVDGTEPTAESPIWDVESLTLTETTQLRATVFSAGAIVGLSSAALYIRRTFDVSADVPIIILEGYGAGKPEDKVTWLDLGVMVFEPPAGGAISLSELPTLAARAGYHRRGQSSSSFAKTPYRVELWGTDDSDEDQVLLGMPEESDWAFVGPCTDRTLVRNAFVYSLAAEMNLVTMQLRFADVYINQDGGPLEESDYEGVYAVTQSVKNQKSRLDLKQLREDDTELPDITGGYIFKFDQAAIDDDETEIPCVSEGGDCFSDLELVDPDPYNAVQMDWISKHLSEFHDLLHAEPIGDYASMMDLPSFVDHFIVNEITRDVDAYIRSHFMHKERGGLITAGPIWDYNFALGNFGDALEGWQWEDGRQGSNQWHRKLGPDPEFIAKMAARYQELRVGGILSDEQLFARLDAITAPLTNAATHDLQRWPVGECNFGGFGMGGPGGDGDGDGDFVLAEAGAAAAEWQTELQDMKTWITERMIWLDGQWL